MKNGNSQKATGGSKPSRPAGFQKASYDRPVYRQFRVVGLAVFLPFVMVAGPIAGYLAGDWIGRHLLSGANWPGLAGLGLGLVAGIHQMVVIIRRLIHELK